MRVLVTGGAGFLGSHLVERLVSGGAEVVVLDDLSTGSIENLAAVRHALDLEIGCATDVELVLALSRGCDRIVHLASTVGVERVAAEPERTREVIARGADAVLRAQAAGGIPAIVVSSSEVYGFAPPAPVSESDLPDSIEGGAPRLAYARAKLAADRAALARAAAGGAVLVVRPFNLVGPRQTEDGGAVLPRFVQAALRGEDLVVHGDGSQRRSFLDVRDAADRLSALVLLGERATGALNLGGSIERSMLALAHEVVAVLDSRSRVRCAPWPLARGGVEIARRVPDLTRMSALVGAVERHALADSIHALAASLRAPALT